MNNSRPRRFSCSAVCAATVLAGLLGCVLWAFDAHRAYLAASARSGITLASNPFFFVPNLTTEHRLFSAVPVDGIFRLEEGDLFRLEPVESADFTYKIISFDLRIERGDVQDIYFRAGAGGYYRVRLSLDPEERSGFAYVPPAPGGPGISVPLGKEAPWNPSRGVWHRYRLLFSRDLFSLEVDRAESFEFRHGALAEGAVAFMTAAGRPGLDNISMEADRKGELYLEAEPFDAPEGGGTGEVLAHPVAAAVMGLLLAALYAWWLAMPRRLGFLQAFRAVVFCFSVAIPLALLRWIGALHLDPWYSAAAPFLLGLLYGIVRLPRLAMAPGRDGSLRAARGGAWSVLLGIAVLAAVLVPAGSLLSSRLDWGVGEALDGERTGSREPMTFDDEYALDPSNHCTLPTPADLRDFRLVGEARLAPGTQAEIFFRRKGYLDRMALQISTISELGCSWLDESPAWFRQVDPRGLAPLAEETWTPFIVEARGCRINGSVGVKSLPEWVEGRRSQGRAGLLVNRGQGRFRGITITPLDPVVESPPFAVLLREAGWLPGILLLLYAITVALAAWRSPIGWRAFAPMDAVPHLGFAVYLAFVDWGFRPGTSCLFIMCGIVFLGRMAPLVASGRRLGSRLKTVLMPLPAVLASVFFYAGVAEPPSMTQRGNDLRLHEFDPPVWSEMAWYQIPRLRWSNLYLEDHRFRDRWFALEKKPGVFRIVCMGSSSTFGHGMPMNSGWDFPTALEDMLDERIGDRKVEVINAGIRGCDSITVREFYSGVIRRFSPDLVLVNLFYNDTVRRPVSGGYRFMERMKSSAFEQGFLSRLKMDLEVWWNARIYREYAYRLERGEPVPDSALRLSEAGRDAFRCVISDIVDRVQADGARVLLVKEPFREGSRGQWSREAYYGALDEVGIEKNVPVLAPLDAFRREGKNLDDFFIDFIHMNREGNALMAAYLAERIIGLGCLDPP